jgi:hypothetical protein
MITPKLFFVKSDGLYINVNYISGGYVSQGGCFHLYVESTKPYNNNNSIDVQLTKNDTINFLKFIETNKFNKISKKYAPVFWVNSAQNKIINIRYITRIKGKNVYLDKQDRFYQLHKTDYLEFINFMQKNKIM